MRKISVLLAALAAGASTTAFAAELTGPRVEAVVGWDHVRANPAGTGRLNSDGFLYGLGLGYDFAVGGNVALGLDAEISDSTADFDVTAGTTRARLSAGRDLYVGGRITGAVSDKFNVYAKAGYTNARFKGRVTTGATTVSDSANADGFRAGVGAQYMVTSNAYVGAEYRYSNYEAGLSRHQLAATIGYRF
jgi:outer membrane immunogenic protein